MYSYLPLEYTLLTTKTPTGKLLVHLMVLKPLTLWQLMLPQQSTVVLVSHHPSFQSSLQIGNIRIDYPPAFANSIPSLSGPHPRPCCIHKQLFEPTFLELLQRTDDSHICSSDPPPFFAMKLSAKGCCMARTIEVCVVHAQGQTWEVQLIPEILHCMLPVLECGAAWCKILFI